MTAPTAQEWAEERAEKLCTRDCVCEMEGCLGCDHCARIAAALVEARAEGFRDGRDSIEFAKMELAEARAEGERAGREALEGCIEVLAQLYEARSVHNQSVHWLERAKEIRALRAKETK